MAILDKGHGNWSTSDIDYLLTLYPARARNAMIVMLGESEEFHDLDVLGKWLKRHLAAAIDWNSILNPVSQRGWFAEWRYGRQALRLAKSVQTRTL